jgi:large subunit ribosomal protein L1
MKHGKKYRAIAEKIDAVKEYELGEAIALLKGNASAKFDESVEVHIKLGINAKKTNEQVRATVVLPHGTGRGKRVAVVTETAAKEAEKAGAILVGGEEIISGIKEGKIVPGSAFDILIATPDMMSKLAPIAKILGPKGLMPSPKNETVTTKVADSVEMLSKGKKASFKNDDGGNIHQVIGKLSFDASALIENHAALFETLSRLKPEGFKGRFVKSIVLASTMGPGIRVKA